MARIADPQGVSPYTADGGQHRPPWEQRKPEAAAVVLTPEGQRRLAARAAWLATERIPRFAHSYLDDLDRDGWASAEYGHDVSELAFLTRILQRAITTDQLAPEHPWHRRTRRRSMIASRRRRCPRGGRPSELVSKSTTVTAQRVWAGAADGD
jgi:hypothetical protein